MTTTIATLEMPTLDRAAWRRLIVGGALATAAFDLFGQTLSPMLSALPTLGSKLAPVPLANQVAGIVTGLGGQGAAGLGLGYGLHILAGLVAYPLGWALVAEPLWRRFAPRAPWWAAAIAYGVGLWIFALYVMAHLVAGNPPFLNLTGITWVALYGHVLFALIAAREWRRTGG